MRHGLQASAIGVGLVLLGLTAQLLVPLFTTAAVDAPGQGRAKVPAYAYEPWYSLAVQDGRTKPFQSACTEVVRQITGRSQFEGLDPVAVVLAWMFAEGAGSEQGNTDWKTYPFILCDHHGLRRQILAEPDTESLEPGKTLSPAELRRSPGFDRLLAEVSRKRKELQGKAHLELTTEHLKAEEVGRRLLLFDTLCGKSASRLCGNALVGDAYVDLREYADVLDLSPDEALATLQGQQSKLSDPFHLVGLDRVPGSSWFSLAELRALQQDSARWRTLVAPRLRESPQHYLSAESRDAFQNLQERTKAGKGRDILAEVSIAFEQRRDANLRKFEAADRIGDRVQANSYFQKLAPSPADQIRFHQIRAKLPKGATSLPPELLEELRIIVREADDAALGRLAKGLELAEGIDVQGTALRMVHLDCLEKLHPELYQDALTSQPIPRAQIAAVLKAFASVRIAYLSGKPDDFGDASRAFFQVLADTTNDDPGLSTISLELAFNRWQPFLWSWITMLAALISLTLGVMSGEQKQGKPLPRAARHSPFLLGGLAVYIVSLIVQTIGFAMRMAIAGRAPVSNMYETVIFVAFMAAVFALILECVYRRGFIALAGAAVATLALVLADQLPLALDPKISPMVPVLRTNYWLTVHVLTIVSSYAAGTLAWGLGNMTLVLLVFRRAKGGADRDSLKTLAHYTYRALQIAVLLLATGTFLGGWWAAESWGRFWGWDPKEVGALIALICYVIPLHARYLGWVQDFGLAVAAVLCYASILLSWYVVNFLVAAGLHSYGFSSGGGGWVLWASLLNIEWVLIAAILVHGRAGHEVIEQTQTA